MSTIRTFTGKNVDVLNPLIEDIDIRDIAHGLANRCRFNGMTRDYLSVAQHSIHVSQFLPKQYKMIGLLHDSGESWLADLPTPVKRLCPGFKAAETKLLQMVLKKYCNWDHPLPEDVHEVDARMLSTEAYQCVNGDTEYWSHPAFKATAYDFVIEPVAPRIAEQLFLSMFEILGGNLTNV